MPVETVRIKEILGKFWASFNSLKFDQGATNRMVEKAGDSDCGVAKTSLYTYLRTYRFDVASGAYVMEPFPLNGWSSSDDRFTNHGFCRWVVLFKCVWLLAEQSVQQSVQLSSVLSLPAVD